MKIFLAKEGFFKITYFLNWWHLLGGFRDRLHLEAHLWIPQTGNVNVSIHVHIVNHGLEYRGITILLYKTKR